MDGIWVNDQVTVPGRELWLEFSHASGPGGTNVSKVCTRVTLCWHIDSSEVLTEEQKRLVRARLHVRVNANGVLRVSSGIHRSQQANRREAEQRLAALLAKVLEKPKRRVPTRPSRASQERRLRRKRRRGSVKRDRSAVQDW